MIGLDLLKLGVAGDQGGVLFPHSGAYITFYMCVEIDVSVIRFSFS